MSWLFGYIGEHVDLVQRKFNSFCPDPIKKVENEKFVIFGGGSEKTFFTSAESPDSSNWFVCGIGISKINGCYKINDEKDWAVTIKNNLFDESKLHGHYLITIWREDEIVIVTDPLGLRDVYISKHNEGLFFSNRVDWISKFTRSEIDFESFGSRWMLLNQISHDSVLSNIDRHVAKKIKINRSNLEVRVSDCEWSPESFNGGTTEDQIFRDLQNYLNDLISSSHIKLSLSGGIDSRLLLSFLTKYDSDLWDAHTFGSIESTDSIISKKLAAELNFRHELYKIPSPNINHLKQSLVEYSLQTVVNNSPREIVQLQNYDMLKNSTGIIIDGGFGEIWRRSFFKKIALFGSKDVLNFNPDNLYKKLLLPRADIFCDEINTKMMKGCKSQLIELAEKLPNPNKIGVENWLDLFAIKTRLPNYYGPEQARVDSLTAALMPLIQLPILRHLFSVKLGNRRNGKLVKAIIKRNDRRLMKYHLAKNDSTYPFYLTPLQSQLYVRIINKLNTQKPQINKSSKKFEEEVFSLVL